MDTTAMKDKLVLDISDVPELAALLAGKSPGDEISFKGKATLDSSEDGLAVLSVTEITVGKGKAPKAKPEPLTPEEEAAEAAPGTAAMKQFTVETDEAAVPA